MRQQLHLSQLKFITSKETGELIAFISLNAKTKKLKGVRETSKYKKKICVLSKDLKGTCVENVLYNVKLKEMLNMKGYVVVSAIPVLFKAIVKTIIEPMILYQVNISFGNKIIFFDPVNGGSPYSKTKEGVIKVLQKRLDIDELTSVLEEFAKQADYLLTVMQNDGFNLDTESEY